MSRDVKFEKTVYSKEEYEKLVDTSFSDPEGPISVSEQLDDQPTIVEFFQMYSDLFYDIPELGEINSHEYLVKQSSEYIGFDSENEEILALQEEIAQLRRELLEEQKKNIELTTGQSIDIDTIGEGENTVGGFNVISTNTQGSY
jgi:hypothetical protein